MRTPGKTVMCHQCEILDCLLNLPSLPHLIVDISFDGRTAYTLRLLPRSVGGDHKQQASVVAAMQVSLAPPIAALAASAVAGSAADGLVAAGWPVARVRKAAQCTAFLGPALCLAGAAFVDDAWGAVGAAP